MKTVSDIFGNGSETSTVSPKKTVSDIFGPIKDTSKKTVDDIFTVQEQPKATTEQLEAANARAIGNPLANRIAESKAQDNANAAAIANNNYNTIVNPYKPASEIQPLISQTTLDLAKGNQNVPLGEAANRNFVSQGNTMQDLLNAKESNIAQQTIDYASKPSNTKVKSDTFGGLIGSNYRLGRIGMDENLAWSKAAETRSEAQTEQAKTIGKIAEQYAILNNDSLESTNNFERVVANYSQYIPQLLDQLGYSAAGAAISTALKLGTKAGIIAGSGLYSFRTMQGAAFKVLSELTDKQTAIAMAQDEALISSAIEMGDIALDLVLLGIPTALDGIIETLSKGALKGVAKPAVALMLSQLKAVAGKDAYIKFATKLAEYGINILQEGLEEQSQESISIANEKRAKEGQSAGIGSLIKQGLTGDQSPFRQYYGIGADKNALSESDRERIYEAGQGGRDVAIGMGAVGAATGIGLNKVGNVLESNRSQIETGQAIKDKQKVNEIFNQAKSMEGTKAEKIAGSENEQTISDRKLGKLQQETQKEAVKKGEASSTGGLVRNDLSKKIQSRTARVLDTIGRATNVSIVLDENMKEGNADWDVNTRTIRISPNSKNPIAVVVTHELVHELQTSNPEAYKKLESYVDTALKNSKTRDILSKSILAAYDGNEKVVDQEVVAHYVEWLAPNINEVEKLVQIDRKTSQAIFDVLSDILRKAEISWEQGLGEIDNTEKAFVLGNAGNLDDIRKVANAFRDSLRSAAEREKQGIYSNLEDMPAEKKKDGYIQLFRSLGQPYTYGYTNLSDFKSRAIAIMDRYGLGDLVRVKSDGLEYTAYVDPEKAVKRLERKYGEDNTYTHIGLDGSKQTNIYKGLPDEIELRSITSKSDALGIAVSDLIKFIKQDDGLVLQGTWNSSNNSYKVPQEDKKKFLKNYPEVAEAQEKQLEKPKESASNEDTKNGIIDAEGQTKLYSRNLKLEEDKQNGKFIGRVEAEVPGNLQSSQGRRSLESDGNIRRGVEENSERARGKSLGETQPRETEDPLNAPVPRDKQTFKRYYEQLSNRLENVISTVNYYSEQIESEKDEEAKKILTLAKDEEAKARRKLVSKVFSYNFRALAEENSKAIPYATVTHYSQGKIAWYYAGDKGLKSSDPMLRDVAIEYAAETMSPFIPDNAVIIPMPSSKGTASEWTVDLAGEISNYAEGSEVANVIGMVPRESSRKLKEITGKAPKTEALLINGMTPEKFAEKYKGKYIVVIDNVISSGNTAKDVINFIRNLRSDEDKVKTYAVAYAKGWRSTPNDVRDVSPLKYETRRYQDDDSNTFVKYKKRLRVDERYGFDGEPKRYLSRNIPTDIAGVTDKLTNSQLGMNEVMGEFSPNIDNPNSTTIFRLSKETLKKYFPEDIDSKEMHQFIIDGEEDKWFNSYELDGQEFDNFEDLSEYVRTNYGEWPLDYYEKRDPNRIHFLVIDPRNSENDFIVSANVERSKMLSKNLEVPSYAPTFYSKLQNEVANYKGEKLGASSIIPYLRGKGVKDEEIKWSGIEVFLDGKKSVTKDELLNYLKASELVVGREIRTESSGGRRYILEDDAGSEFNSVEEAAAYLEETFGFNIENIDDVTYDDHAEIRYTYLETDPETGEQEQQEDYIDVNYSSDSDTKWQDYKLDISDGHDYREILYRIPPLGKNDFLENYTNNAMSTHWGVPGVVAHARVQDFEDWTGGLGKRILFIDEIQSDWHNAIQKNGSVSAEEYKLSKEYQKLINDRYQLYARGGENSQEYTDYTTRIGEIEKQLYPITKKWEELSDERFEFYDDNIIKIEDALYDTVRELYGEKRHIDASDAVRFYIENQMYKLTDDDVNLIKDAIDSTLDESQKKDISAYWDMKKRLKDLHDKSRAEEGKFASPTPNAPFKNYVEYVLKNLLRDAAEGGYDYLAWTTGKMQEERWSDRYAEGYRIEYDQEIPKFLSKFGKQFGAKISTVNAESFETGETYEIPAIEITPEMQLSVLFTGQPLFSKSLNPNIDVLNEMISKSEEAGQEMRSNEEIQYAHNMNDILKYDTPEVRELRAIIKEKEKLEIKYRRSGNGLEQIKSIEARINRKVAQITKLGLEATAKATKEKEKALKELSNLKEITSLDKKSRSEDNRSIAKRLKEYTDSKTKDSIVEEKVKALTDYVVSTSKDKQDETVLRQYVDDIISVLVDGIKIVSSRDQETYDGLRAYLKNTPIKIAERDRSNIPGYSDFARKYRFKLNIREDGKLIDTIWDDLQERFPGQLDPSITHPADMLQALADLVDDLTPKEEDIGPEARDYYKDKLYLLIVETAKNLKPSSILLENKELAKALGSAKSELEKARKSLEEVSNERKDITEKYRSEKKDKAKANDEKEKIQKKYDQTLLKYQEVEQKYKDTKRQLYYQTIHKDALARQLAKKVEEFKQRMADSDARRENRANKERLFRLAKRAQTLIKKHYAGDEDVQGLQDLIKDLDTVGIGIRPNGYTRSDGVRVKGQLELENIRKQYELEKATNPDFLMDERLENFLANRLDNIKIADMSAEDVLDLIHAIQNLMWNIENKDAMIDSIEHKLISQTANGSMMEIEASKGSDPARKMDKVKNFYEIKSLRPSTFFKKIAGFKSGELTGLYNELEKGQTKQMKFLMEAQTPFDNLNKKYEKELHSWYGNKMDIIQIGVNKNTSEKIFINKPMRVSLYLHSLNDQNMQHIQNGFGISIPDMNLYKQGKIKEAYAHSKKIKITKSQIAEIWKDATEAEKEYAKVAWNYFNVQSKAAINEASIKLKGYELAGVENYFPITIDKDLSRTNTLVTFADDGSNKMIEGKGFLKERTPRSSAAVVLEGIDTVLERQIRDVSIYYGMAVPIHNLINVWNYSSGEESLRSVLAKTWGADARDYIKNLVMDLQTPDKVTSLFEKLRSNYAGTVLAFNPAVAFGQAASFPTAAATLGFSATNKALKRIASGKATGLDVINKYTPLLWYRSKGYIDTEMGAIKNANPLVRTVNKVTGAKWIQKVDMLTVQGLWTASEERIKETNPELKVGSEEFYKATAELFDRTVYDTQPNYTTLQRPEILRSKSELERNAFMFMTQRMQNYNMMYEAFGEYLNAAPGSKKKARDQVILTALSLFIANTVYTAMKNAVRRAIGKDKDEWVGEDGELKILSGLTNNWIGNMMGSIALADKLYEIVKAAFFGGKYYDTFSVLSFNTLNSLASSGVKFVSDLTEMLASGTPSLWIHNNPKIMRDLHSLVQNFGYFFGIPLKNMEEYGIGIMSLVDPRLGTWYENIYSRK